MNTRRLLLGLFVPLCLALGCSGLEPPQEEVRPPAEKPKAGEPPQAPMPHVKKTTAELLVGTWKMVTDDDGKPLPFLLFVTAEFTREGRFTFIHADPARRLVEKTNGTYKLKDRTITLTAEASDTEPERSWELRIETITDSNLHLIPKTRKAPEGSGFVRVENK